jgi:hypothetical protein
MAPFQKENLTKQELPERVRLPLLGGEKTKPANTGKKKKLNERRDAIMQSKKTPRENNKSERHHAVFGW